MKLLKSYFLSLSIILNLVVPYQVKAQPSDEVSERKLLFSEQEMFGENGNNRLHNLYLESKFGKVVNEYRLLGFSHFPDITHDGFKESLKGSNLVLSFPANELLNNEEYKRAFNSIDGRIRLQRLYDGALSTLSVIRSDMDLIRNLQPEFNKIYGEVVLEKLFESETDIETRRQKNELESFRRLFKNFEGERSSILKRSTQAQQLLGDPYKRAEYNYKNGIQPGTLRTMSNARLKLGNIVTNLKAAVSKKHISIPVKDPFGKDVHILWPTEAPDEKFDAKKFRESIKSGTFEVGKVGLALLAILFITTEFKMIADYKSNPKAFEDRLEALMTSAMPLSVGAFFVGGHYSSVGYDIMKGRMADATLLQLAKNKPLKLNNPKLYSELVRASMITKESTSLFSRMRSRPAMIGGLFSSLFTYSIFDRWADNLSVCRDYNEDKKNASIIKNGDYPEYKRDQLAKLCEKTLASIANEIMTSPETWMILTSLLSTDAILTWGMKKQQFLKYNFTNNLNIMNKIHSISPDKFSYKVIVKARGFLLSPFVSTVVGFLVFSLVFEGLLRGLRWGYGKLTLNIPASEAAQDVRELLSKYQKLGWNMKLLCDDRTLLKGGLFDYLKPLASIFYDTNTCGSDLIKGFIDNHKNLNLAWREKLKKPAEDAISNWLEYTWQATNLQGASYLLYKDIAEQIKAQRNSGRVVKIKRALNPENGLKEALGYMNSHLYNHPLPLFRSDIFFGWSYNLVEDSNFEDVAFPVYDGQTTTWSERYNTKYGTKSFDQRLSIFHAEVLPKVIFKLDLQLKFTNDESEKHYIKWILVHLNSALSNKSNLYALAKGLQKISERLESTDTAFSCMNNNADCFWTKFQEEFFDDEFWKLDRNGIAKFMGNSSYYAGYQTTSFSPYGVKPVGPGQTFFLTYSDRLINNNLDPYYYNSEYNGLVDYLLKQMVCGVDVVSGDSMQKNGWFGWKYKMGFKSPEFLAPKIALKGKVNPCRDGNRSWSKSSPHVPTFYNYIEDKNNSSLSYGGIVDFLYNEASDDFVQNFDHWWSVNVSPQFNEILDVLYNDYFKAKVIDVKLHEMIVAENNDNNCYVDCLDFSFNHKNGYAAAIKQEMDTYYTYFLEPYLKTSPLDTKHLGYEVNETEARNIIIKDFKNLKADIYDIFDVLSDRSISLSRNELILEYNSVLAQVRGEASIDGSVMDRELLKIQALNLLLKKKDYSIRSLFKTDEEDILVDLVEGYKSLLVSVKGLSEQEINDVLTELDSMSTQMLAEFKDYENRDGLVVIQYNEEKNEQGRRPTQDLVRYFQNINESTLNELIDLQNMKYSFRIQP